MWTASALCKAGEGEHLGPRGGPEVPRTVTPRHRLRMDSFMPHPPHMPSRCPHGVTLLPCATTRCYCGTATSHNLGTTPKVASTVNVPPHTRSSHSGEGMARASLNHDEALEDDFQTQHTLVHRVMWQEDTGHQSSAEGRLECSRGSPRQWTGYHVDISEEEKTLEMVDPTW